MAAEILKQEPQEPAAEGPDTSRAEHLAGGVKPIRACVGTASEYGEDISNVFGFKKEGRNVNYYGNPFVLFFPVKRTQESRHMLFPR